MSLIENYGLFWKRDEVYWGRQKSKGHFKGVAASSKKESPVDFREQRGIYVLYDENFQIVYVGQAGRGTQSLFLRLRSHTTDHLAARWSRISWFGICKVRESSDKTDAELDLADSKSAPLRKDVLNQFEAVLIYAAEPKLNRRGGNFGSAMQYLQFRDAESLGLTLDEKLDLTLKANANV